MKRHVAASATALLLALALSALAAESPFLRVALLLPACEQPGLGANELREAVALDLRDQHLTLAPPGELAPATDVLVRIDATCGDESELTLHAQFGDESRSRRADLRELPPAQRARALSLAVAELLALFGQPPMPGTGELSETTAPPASAAAAAPPVVAPATSAVSQPPRPKPAAPAPSGNSQPHQEAAHRDGERPSLSPREWRLSLAPELRVFDGTWLWGGRALVHYGAWSAGVDLLRAHVSIETGSVATLVVHGTFAYSFELMRSERSGFEAGPRLGLGRTFMTAEAAAVALAYDAQDVYLDAALAARYSLRLSPVFGLGIAAELGYAGGPIGYADNRKVASTSGAFAALLVDASARF